jgi:excisionase family DNA binding protein
MPEHHPPRRDLATLERAADYADTSVHSIRRWISQGRLPAWRLGPRQLRVDLRDIDAMLVPLPTTAGERP